MLQNPPSIMMPQPHPETNEKEETTDYTDFFVFSLCPLCPLWLNYFHKSLKKFF